MKPQLLGSFIAFVVLFDGNMHGQTKHPTDGTVYNTKEASSFQYDCKLKRKTTVECDFTFSFVRKKADPKDWRNNINNSKQKFLKT